MEEAISIALERNLFALSLFQREDEHNCFHVLGATKRLLVFSYITFSQSHAGDSAVLRQFNYIITNTCGLIYGITISTLEILLFSGSLII
jgi:hypothetical protein